jgi:integrator complex subunit 4
LNLSPWTEPGVVIIRIVQSFEPDLPGLDEYIMRYPNFSSLTNSLNSGLKLPVSSSVISEHLKYRLCPTIAAARK